MPGPPIELGIRDRVVPGNHELWSPQVSAASATAFPTVGG